MVERFENEFPETRLSHTTTSRPVHIVHKSSDDADVAIDPESHFSESETVLVEPHLSDDEGVRQHHTLSRHNSDVSLASRALGLEEGRMHKLGQEFRRSLAIPDTEAAEHPNLVSELGPYHLQLLRDMIEGTEGKAILDKIEKEHKGPAAVMAVLSDEASTLRKQLKDTDPEGWQRFIESQKVTQRNQAVAGLTMDASAIE